MFTIVDPTSISMAVTALLARFGGRVLDRGIDKAADEFGDALAEPVGQLLHRVREGTAGDGYAAGALQRWEQEPDSDSRQAVLQDALAHLIGQDDDFAAQLQVLVERIEQVAGPNTVQQVSDSGAVAGRDVIVNAEYAAGRDLHLGSPPSP